MKIKRHKINFVMDIQDKTKEKLISELKELLHESDSLKALKEKRADELIIANIELAFQKKNYLFECR
jgi:hypothetical protein